MKISENIIHVGVNDEGKEKFEGQYKLKNGVTYNSYLIKDEKNTLLDTTDKKCISEWIKNVERELNGEKLDYLIISHLEPDHSKGIEILAQKYPNMKLVSNQKVFAFLPQFFNIENLEERKILVNEGDVLNLGKHTLHFIMAPMVHWPEVMMEYEEKEKILFSADAFGTFGKVPEYEKNAQETITLTDKTLKQSEKETEWLEEARRYYLNIVGKYGIQVQAVLKKLENVEVNKICPLHGPILEENLSFYLEKYNTWSSYKWEVDGILIVCATMHGHTLEAMEEFKKILEKKTNKEIKLLNIIKDDISYALADAFKYKTLVLASPTYNAELFPAMDSFIRLLKSKAFQNRDVALIENGTWAPMAKKIMIDTLLQMKNIDIVEPCITIKTKMNNETLEKFEELANALISRN